MTLGVAIKEMWESLGSPDDLDPSKVGITKLRDALNEAQDAVATWIDDRGRHPEFDCLKSRALFTPTVLTGTVSLVKGSKNVTLPAAITGAEDRFKRWVFSTDDATVNVLRSTVNPDGTITLKLQLPSTQDGSFSFVLSQRMFAFGDEFDEIDSNDERVTTVLRITCANDDSVLDTAPVDEHLDSASLADPSEWRLEGNKIVFDSAPSGEKDYWVEYIRMPIQVDAAEDSFELPDNFSQAIVLKACCWGWRRLQDFQAAYATKKDFMDLMTRLITSNYYESEDDYFRVRSR